MMKAFNILVTIAMATRALAEPEPYHNTDYGKRLEPPYPHSHEPSYPAPAYAKSALPTAPQYKPVYGQDYKPQYTSSYYCDPRSPPKCAQHANATYCLKDYDYPESEIQYAIDYDPLVLKKYADVADQSADNLVDGVNSLEEKKFDYSSYNGNTFDESNWVGGAGYICPSEVLYARPVRAKNTDGEWRVIVQNVAYYTQTQRMETCLFPGASCRTLAPCYRSHCAQKYIYHRMLSFDPCDSSRGLFIDTYKLPSACSCHIPLDA